MMTPAMTTLKMMRTETEKILMLVLLDHAGGIGVPTTALPAAIDNQSEGSSAKDNEVQNQWGSSLNPVLA